MELWKRSRPLVSHSVSPSVRQSVRAQISETTGTMDMKFYMVIWYVLGMMPVYLEFWLIFGAFSVFLKLLFIKVFLFDLSCRISIMLYKPRIVMTWISFRGHDLIFQGQMGSRTLKFSFLTLYLLSYRYSSLNFIYIM